jgi:hypothetical protein|eukprot:COSAG01_NODE_6774_length_3504_cov_27.969457_6_plen_134_part_00
MGQCQCLRAGASAQASAVASFHGAGAVVATEAERSMNRKRTAALHSLMMVTVRHMEGERVSDVISGRIDSWNQACHQRIEAGERLDAYTQFRELVGALLSVTLSVLLLLLLLVRRQWRSSPLPQVNKRRSMRG